MDAPVTAAELREKAAHYRELATLVIDERAIAALLVLANEYDEMAARLDDG